MSTSQWLVRNILINTCNKIIIRQKQCLMNNYVRKLSLIAFAHTTTRKLACGAKCHNVYQKTYYSSTNWRISSALHYVNMPSNEDITSRSSKIHNSVTQVLVTVESTLKELPDVAIPASEWEKLQRDCLKQCPKCEKILNFKVMETLHSECKVELAISFKNFLDNQSHSNIITDAQFMLVCADKYPDITLKEYTKLKSNYNLKYVNTTIGRLLIRSLCLTSAWKEAIDIYDRMVELNENKLNISLLNILIAAVCNRDYQTYYRLLGKYEIEVIQMFPKHFSTMVYELWKERVIPLDCCFELLKLNGLCLTKDQMVHIHDFCASDEKYSIQSQKEIVDRTQGVCQGCGEKLPGSFISMSQFQDMADNLEEAAYGRQHVYKNTTPEELANFRTFLQRQRRFDFVVDGLNIFHQRRLVGLKQLLSRLKHMKPNARILVIKKPYMLKNKSRRDISQVLSMATFYDIEQESADDLFLLLAAFHSGPDTHVISDDNFRDHKAKLDNQQQFIFKRWQSYRQILYTDNSKNNTIQMPTCYDSLTVESLHGWHVPYEFVQGQANFINSHLFMCIKKECWEPSADLLKLLEARQAVIHESRDIKRGDGTV